MVEWHQGYKFITHNRLVSFRNSNVEAGVFSLFFGRSNCYKQKTGWFSAENMWRLNKHERKRSPKIIDSSTSSWLSDWKTFCTGLLQGKLDNVLLNCHYRRFFPPLQITLFFFIFEFIGFLFEKREKKIKAISVQLICFSQAVRWKKHSFETEAIRK